MKGLIKRVDLVSDDAGIPKVVSCLKSRTHGVKPEANDDTGHNMSATKVTAETSA